MNDIFSCITGVAMHAYSVAAFIALICIPGKMMIRSLYGKSPI